MQQRARRRETASPLNTDGSLQESQLSHGWTLEYCKNLDYLKTVNMDFFCYLVGTTSTPEHARITVQRRKEPWKDVNTRWFQTCSPIRCRGQPPGRKKKCLHSSRWTVSTATNERTASSRPGMEKSELSRDIWIAGVLLFIFGNLVGTSTKAVVGVSKMARTTTRTIAQPRLVERVMATDSFMPCRYFSRRTRVQTSANVVHATVVQRKNTSPDAPKTNTSRVLAHVTVAQDFLPTRVTLFQGSWWVCVFESALSQKSSCSHMFHRNLLGLPDHPPVFPTALVSESGRTFADPRSGSLFGRMAEQSPITGWGRLWIAEVENLSDLTLKRVMECPMNAAKCRGRWVFLKCWTFTVERKKGSWFRKCVVFSTWQGTNSVWKEESSRMLWKESSTSSSRWLYSIIWGWGGHGHKKLGKEKLWYCSIRNQPTTWVTKTGAVSGESMGWSGSRRKQ